MQSSFLLKKRQNCTFGFLHFNFDNNWMLFSSCMFIQTGWSKVIKIFKFKTTLYSASTEQTLWAKCKSHCTGNAEPSGWCFSISCYLRCNLCWSLSRLVSASGIYDLNLIPTNPILSLSSISVSVFTWTWTGLLMNMMKHWTHRGTPEINIVV